MGSKGPVVFKYFQSGQGASKELWRGQKSVTRPQSPFESALNFGSIKMFWARLQCCFIYHRSLLHVCKRKLQKNKIHLFPMRSGISDTANYLLSVVIFCWLPSCDHEGAGLSTSHLRIEISVSANHLQSKEKWCRRIFLCSMLVTSSNYWKPRVWLDWRLLYQPRNP